MEIKILVLVILVLNLEYPFINYLIIKRIIKKYSIDVEGIHIHTGSDIIEPKFFECVTTLILNLSSEFENIKSIDFGSGFKVRYKKMNYIRIYIK